MNGYIDDTLTSRKISKRVQRLFIIEQGFEFFVQKLVTGAFLAVLLSRNGVPDWLVGILTAFISLTCIFQVFSASIVKRGASVRKIIFFLAMANEILFLLLYVIPIFSLTSEVKCVIFTLLIFSAYVCYNLINPLKYSWYMLYVPADERGTYTAKKEIISLIGGIAFSFIMGGITDYFNARGQENNAFAAAAFTIVILSAVHLYSIGATPEHSLEISRGNKNGFFSSLKILKNRTVCSLVLLEVLWKCGLMVSSSYYGIFQTSTLGFTLTFVSAILTVQYVSRVIASMFMGRIADRYGWWVNLTICFSCAALSFFPIIFCNTENAKVMFILYEVFMGIAMAGINSGLANIYFDYLPVAERTAALGVKGAIGGVCGFLATTIAGAVLARIQSSGLVIAGNSVYGQQIFSLFSFIVTVVCIFYVVTVVKKLKKIKE